MAAHKISLESSCNWGGCPKRATFLVRSTYNVDMGKYCAKHADAKVAQLQASEHARFGD